MMWLMEFYFIFKAQGSQLGGRDCSEEPKFDLPLRLVRLKAFLLSAQEKKQRQEKA